MQALHIGQFELMAPIVIFTYNRLYQTRQTIESLKKDNLAIKSDLFIFSDGAKNAIDSQQVRDVRKYLDTIDGFHSIKIVRREKNYGLCDNIIDGVSTVVRKYGKIIVLEDDVVVSKYFLEFMNDALEIYENRKDIWQISGSVEPYRSLKKASIKETFLLDKAQCGWGWATWDDRWEYYHRNPADVIKRYDTSDKIRLLNEHTTPSAWQQIVMNYDGRLRTWAVFLDEMIYEHHGKVLWPKYILTKNIGFDGTGMNSGVSNNYDVLLEHIRITDFTNEEEIDYKLGQILHEEEYGELERFEKWLKECNVVTIYGAGYYGKALLSYLCSKKVHVQRFVVTKPMAEEEAGIPLQPAKTLSKDEMIIVAISEKWHPEVKILLKSMGVNNVVYMSNKLLKLVEAELFCTRKLVFHDN